MLKIDGTVEDATKDYGLPLFRLGFRAFFLAAAVFAVFSMAIWMANYVFAVEFLFSAMPPHLWHAHEMIFGYTMAVVAGFLLTAIKNWTGVEVLRGRPLAFLLAIWMLARILPYTGFQLPTIVTAAIDCAFLLLLVIVCLRPVLKVKQYKQLGIISKLFLLLLCNLVFYLGLNGDIDNGVQWGLYSALYIIIALILVMMRRVMPMFIKNGIEGEIEIKNHAFLDNASLLLLLCLWVLDVFTAYTHFMALTAALLALLHAVRLSGWYTSRIWPKPLLWVLVVAYGFIIAGFASKALSVYFAVSPFISVHAFTVGGIGLVTIGMMSRVSLGHTGRDVFNPPAIVLWIFLLLLLAAVVRVVFPLFNMSMYVYWVGLSQVLWIVAFAIFIIVYAPMFLTSRVDGRDG